jgi:hypothetical protein
MKRITSVWYWTCGVGRFGGYPLSGVESGGLGKSLCGNSVAYTTTASKMPEPPDCYSVSGVVSPSGETG